MHLRLLGATRAQLSSPILGAKRIIGGRFKLVARGREERWWNVDMTVEEFAEAAFEHLAEHALSDAAKPTAPTLRSCCHAANRSGSPAGPAMA